MEVNLQRRTPRPDGRSKRARRAIRRWSTGISSTCWFPAASTAMTPMDTGWLPGTRWERDPMPAPSRVSWPKPGLIPMAMLPAARYGMPTVSWRPMVSPVLRNAWSTGPRRRQRPPLPPLQFLLHLLLPLRHLLTSIPAPPPTPVQEVEPTPTPTPTPAPTETPTPTSVPFQTSLSFAHTVPGVASEVYLDVQAPPGTSVTATLERGHGSYFTSAVRKHRRKRNAKTNLGNYSIRDLLRNWHSGGSRA